MIVYDVASHGVVSFIKGRKAMLVSDAVLDKGVGHYRYRVMPSLDALGIDERQQALFGEVDKGGQPLCFAGRKIVFVNQKNNVSPPTIQVRHVDFLIVAQDSVDALKPWLEGVTIGLLIFTGDEKLSEETVAQMKVDGVRYYSVFEQGAYVCHF